MSRGFKMTPGKFTQILELTSRKVPTKTIIELTGFKPSTIGKVKRFKTFDAYVSDSKLSSTERRIKADTAHLHERETAQTALPVDQPAALAIDLTEVLDNINGVLRNIASTVDAIELRSQWIENEISKLPHRRNLLGRVER